MIDLNELNRRLNTDKAFQFEFVKNPIEVLRREGLTLSPEMEREVLETIAKSTEPKQPVPGATTMDTNVGVAISHRIFGGSGMLLPPD
jgi:hypothetical protein